MKRIQTQRNRMYLEEKNVEKDREGEEETKISSGLSFRCICRKYTKFISRIQFRMPLERIRGWFLFFTFAPFVSRHRRKNKRTRTNWNANRIGFFAVEMESTVYSLIASTIITEISADTSSERNAARFLNCQKNGRERRRIANWRVSEWDCTMLCAEKRFVITTTAH